MATLEEAMGSAPLWVIGICFFIMLCLSSFIGLWLRSHFDKQRDDSPSDGYLLSAVLALLGLLIAFTFSLAVTRYDTRRMMAVEEANAMSTVWLRYTLADGAPGTALRDALKRYADLRLTLPSTRDPDAVEARSAREQAVLWQHLRAALPTIQPSPVASTLVTATTEMFDAAARRKAEREARIPARVLDVVSLYALMSAGIVGYVLGRRGDRRHTAVTLILFGLLTLAFTLILDLDRPWSGNITIPQTPLIEARAAMN